MADERRQVALLPALAVQRSRVIPIPGTRFQTHLEENVRSVDLVLSPEQWKRLQALDLRDESLGC